MPCIPLRGLWRAPTLSQLNQQNAYVSFILSKETGCLDLEPACQPLQAIWMCPQDAQPPRDGDLPASSSSPPRAWPCLLVRSHTHTCLLPPTTVSHPLTKPVDRIASSRFPRTDAPIYARRASSQRSLQNHCYHQQPAQPTRPGVNSRCPFLRGSVRYNLEPEDPALFGSCALSGWNCPVCNHHHMYPSP